MLSVTFTYIKASVSSARGVGGDKNCCLKLSKIIFTNMSVGPLLPFEDFTSSVCCPLDRLPASRRVSQVVGLPP